MRATRLSVANYNTTLSSDSLETGTGSSNSLRSTIQSLGFRTSRRIARNPANAILAPAFGIFLLIYALGIWRRRRWAGRTLRTADSADLRLVLSAEIRFGATTKMRRTTGIRRSRMGKRTSLPEC